MKIFLGLVVAVLLLTSRHVPGSSNDASRLALIESLLNRGEITTDNSPLVNTMDMVYHHGHYYSDKPPLLSLYSTAMSVPIAALVPPKGETGLSVLYTWVVLTSSGLAVLALVALFARAARIAGLEGRPVGVGILALLTGTLILPYAVTYNSHIVEAALAFLAFLLLLRHRVHPRLWHAAAVGALAGLIWTLHPLSGTALGLAFGFYFLASRLKNALLYSLVSLAVLGGGLGLNHAMYGIWQSFYLVPESFLYDNPDGRRSDFMDRPMLQGLNPENVSERFRELGLPQADLDKMLVALEQRELLMRDLPQFAYEKWIAYDHLAWSPLLILCLLLALRPGPFRREGAFAALSAVGLWLTALLVRAEPGYAFGNRYMLAVMPALVLCGLLNAAASGRMPAFRFLAGCSFVLLLPGFLDPWRPPSPLAMKINVAACGLLVLATLAAGLWPELERRFGRALAWLSARRALVAGLLVAGGAAQITLCYWETWSKRGA